MRNIALLLASFVLIGCGNDHMSHRSPPTLGTAFIVPSITELSPPSVPVNSVPFTLTVNGSNFGTDAILFWNGAAQHTIFVTSNQLMVAVTPEDLDFTGAVPLYVRTLGQNSNTVDFEVTPQ